VNVPFEIDVREAASGEIVVVQLSGEFDLAGVELFTETVISGLSQDSHKEMVFDLSGLAFLDSSGLNGLIRAMKEATTRGARFTVYKPSGAVSRLFELVRATDFLELREDLPD
jgi:anti-anti-sigma factor